MRLDLMMPKMNGWEVLDQPALEDEGRMGSVIGLFAALPGKGLTAEQAASVHAVLPKPFDLHRLREVVRTCIAR